jgi:hypothetical protein
MTIVFFNCSFFLGFPLHTKKIQDFSPPLTDFSKEILTGNTKGIYCTKFHSRNSLPLDSFFQRNSYSNYKVNLLLQKNESRRA